MIIGSFASPYGVHGWIKVMSATKPHSNIFAYKPWYTKTPTGWQALTIQQHKVHGKALLVKLAQIDDCDQARQLLHAAIATDQLPPLPEGEYYWHELINLQVHNVAGVDFGKVEELLETGANDVLSVVDATGKQRLLPYIDQVVLKIDRQQGTMLVDWQADWDD